MSCARCGRERSAAGNVELVFGRRTSRTEYGVGVQTKIETTKVSNTVEFTICNECLRQRAVATFVSVGMALAALGLFIWAIMTYPNPPIGILGVCLAAVITSVLFIFFWRRRFLAPLLQALKPEVRSAQLLSMAIRRIK